MERRRKTRNERRRDMLENFVVAVGLIAILAACIFGFLSAWDHPAEQHITGAAYAERFE